jgi:hypothetical protein
LAGLPVHTDTSSDTAGCAVPRSRILCSILLLCVYTGLSGCVAPLIGAAGEGVDAMKRKTVRARAEAGEPAAQYELGKAYCCESSWKMMRTLSAHDNEKATQWLCKAGVENYGPAQLRLAQIYSGNIRSGFGPMSWISSALTDQKSKRARTDARRAWMWASVADANGVNKAAKLRDKIDKRMSTAERDSAQGMLTSWRTLPCTWNEVLEAGSAN